MDAGHPRELGDPLRLVGAELAHHGGQQRGWQIERIERQLVERARRPATRGRGAKDSPGRPAPSRARARTSRRRWPGPPPPTAPVRRTARAAARRAGRAPRRAARCRAAATWILPASSAPQVTRAAELPATSAIPLIVAQRGAGSATRSSAGVQRKVYQSGQPPRGLQTSTPTVAAAMAIAMPASDPARGGGSPGPTPRKSAAVGTMSAAADTRMASCQLSQSPTDTPTAGGVIPRPRLLIR